MNIQCNITNNYNVILPYQIHNVLFYITKTENETTAYLTYMT